MGGNYSDVYSDIYSDVYGVPVLAHVQDAAFAWNSAPGTLSITTSAGSLLVAAIEGFIYSNTPFGLTSVTDSAGNTWTYSILDSSQSPPAGGSYSASGGYYGLSAIAWCLNAQAVTSVTVTAGSNVQFSVSEFSGVPAGATVDAAAASSVLAAGVTSYSAPAISPTGSADVLVAVANSSVHWTGVSSPWTFYGADNVGMAWLITSAAGTYQPTWSGASQDATSSAVLAIGVPPATTSATMTPFIVAAC